MKQEWHSSCWIWFDIHFDMQPGILYVAGIENNLSQQASKPHPTQIPRLPMDCKAWTLFQWPLGLQEILQLAVTPHSCDMLLVSTGDLKAMLVSFTSSFAKGLLVIRTLITLSMGWWSLKPEDVVPHLPVCSPEVEVAAPGTVPHTELEIEQSDRSWRQVSRRQLRDFGCPVRLHNWCEVAWKPHYVEAYLLISFDGLWLHIVHDVHVWARWHAVTIIVFHTLTGFVFHDHWQLLNLSAFFAGSLPRTPFGTLDLREANPGLNQILDLNGSNFNQRLKRTLIRNVNFAPVIESNISSFYMLLPWNLQSESSSSNLYPSFNTRLAAVEAAFLLHPYTSWAETGWSPGVSLQFSEQPGSLVDDGDMANSGQGIYM